MEYGIVYLLVLVRIGCLIGTAPILGGSTVPLKIRLGLSLFMATAVFPLVAPSLEATANFSLWNEPSFCPTSSWQSADNWQIMALADRLFPLILVEIVIGTSLGLGVALLVFAARSAGAIVGQMAGLQWAAAADGSADEGVSAVGQIYGLVAAATFVAMGGVEMLIGGLMDSYTTLPIGMNLESHQIAGLAAEFLQHSFALTLRGVVPVVAAMLTSTLTIGFISRAYPQLNVLSLSLSLNQIILFLLITLTLGSCVWILIGDIEGFLQFIQMRMAELK